MDLFSQKQSEIVAISLLNSMGIKVTYDEQSGVMILDRPSLRPEEQIAHAITFLGNHIQQSAVDLNHSQKSRQTIAAHIHQWLLLGQIQAEYDQASGVMMIPQERENVDKSQIGHALVYLLTLAGHSDASYDSDSQTVKFTDRFGVNSIENL